MVMNLISNILSGAGLALLLVGVIGLIVIGPEAPGEDEQNNEGGV